MRSDRVVFIGAISLLAFAVMLPAPASARPKGTWQSCNTQDLNTNFGASCNDQMQQDIMGNKPYTHVLFCGGDSMLCCTMDNNTNQVINCRKPAGSRIMPGMQGNTFGAAGMAGIQSRGTEGTGAATDEETPISSTLTPDIVKELRQQPSAK